jgi:hypothetical protein
MLNLHDLEDMKQDQNGIVQISGNYIIYVHLLLGDTTGTNAFLSLLPRS